MLSCENLSCARDETPLFANIGFCLAPGALLLLKGPNGIGKTTLMRMLAGLIPADSGQVAWNGQPIQDNADYKRDMTYIGHKSAVKLDATVQENLSFWGKLFDREMLIPAAMAFYGLEALKDAPARQLSAGWQRRVALARLILAPAKLWLLDEPTNFLDDEAVALTGNLIESRVMQGGIVVVASHIMNSAIAAHTLWVADFKA